jgi:glutamate-1-semialdehyde 2,1-aminomutase
MKDLKRSRQLFEEAQSYLPGGVDSPVRAFKAVGGTPPFITRGQGARVYDADGNEYIDYVCSWGPLILGHAFPAVVDALKKAAEQGTSFGASCPVEVELAKAITEAVPSIELVRLVNSGTEATMSALRLARAFTGRDKIIKFAGCYHGHSDGLLVQGGSGLATLGIASSPGVPCGYTENTLVAPYNGLAPVEQLFTSFPGEVAAIIVEPVAANMGVVPPAEGYLQGLRDLTAKHGALLVFDEVITGFRVGYGGAQELYGVTPDLTCLGKIIGGGLPVGAYGGRRDVMEMVAPLGNVYQAGTLSGNPLAMAAGLETLRALREPGVYEGIAAKAAALEELVKKAAQKAGAKVTVNRVGSLLTPFCAAGPVTDYESAAKADTATFGKLFHALLDEGISWAPSQFEAAFISTAHTDGDIRRTGGAFEHAFNKLA